MKRYCTNPYLPLYEHVPDGEPRVFNGRVYIFGSHDAANGEYFCLENYVTWSAPENDLSNWRYEGVIYRRNQDPANADGKLEMFAPDVVQGADGRFYLFYCLRVRSQISVAVSDSPAGPYVFYGYVHRTDGTLLSEFMPYDPAVLVDDDGQAYLYYGFSSVALSQKYHIEISPGSMMVRLGKDMLTVQSEPEAMIPWEGRAAGTDFEGHAFFEASSIRKIGGKYYLVYSSQNHQELCYAVSCRPDGDFRFGGVLIDNMDLGVNGRTVPACASGTNHGGLAVINGKPYIFYHRHTNRTYYSRQGCAEPIRILEDGSIPRTEITSSGLAGAALPAEGSWPAAIACWLGGEFSHRFLSPQNIYEDEDMAFIAQSGEGETAEIYIRNIRNNTFAGYKYFKLDGSVKITLLLRGRAEGTLSLRLGDESAPPAARTELKLDTAAWEPRTVALDARGTVNLVFTFEGKGALDFLAFSFERC